MIKSLLITRPEHDDTTYYLSSYGNETLSTANAKGWKLMDLYRKRANKRETEGLLGKASLVIFNGHGNPEEITGHKNEVLVKADLNENLLRDKIVYAISCSSARTLDPASIRAGALSYTGYDDEFVFLMETDMITRPLEDSTARQFLEHSQVFTSSLIKGNLVEDCFEKAKKNLQENLQKSLASGNPDPTQARYLWWDLQHFVTLGDKKTKI